MEFIAEVPQRLEATVGRFFTGGKNARRIRLGGDGRQGSEEKRDRQSENERQSGLAHGGILGGQWRGETQSERVIQ